MGTQSTFAAALRDFLVTRFAELDLHDVAFKLPHGPAIVARLTTPTSRYLIAREVVELVVKFGQLEELRASLVAEREFDVAVIDNIWSLRQKDAGASSAPRPPARELPHLPLGFVERPEHDQVREALRGDHPLVGITGLPGSGKTTAAIAALNDLPPTCLVCWLDSDETTDIGVADVRLRIARQLGDSADKPPSSVELRRLANAAVGAERLIVVLDEPRGRLDLLVDAARCHPRATIVVTRSDEAALISVGAREAIVLRGLPPARGLDLLAHWAGMPTGGLPELAAELAAAIGFHPLGLRLLGATVANSFEPAAEWEHLAKRLRAASLAELALPGIPELNLAALVEVVLASLPAAVGPVLEALAVPPSGSSIDLARVAQMTALSEDDCRRTADLLIRSSVASRTSRAEIGLQPIVHLHARGRHGFVRRYRELTARLFPNCPAPIPAIAMGEDGLAERLVADTPVVELTTSTPSVGSPLHQAALHGMRGVIDAIVVRGAPEANEVLHDP